MSQFRAGNTYLDAIGSGATRPNSQLPLGNAAIGESDIEMARATARALFGEKLLVDVNRSPNLDAYSGVNHTARSLALSISGSADVIQLGLYTHKLPFTSTACSLCNGEF